jgi:hypothetical protein
MKNLTNSDVKNEPQIHESGSEFFILLQSWSVNTNPGASRRVPHKKLKDDDISSFEVPIVLFSGLEASCVAWKYFVRLKSVVR